MMRGVLALSLFGAMAASLHAQTPAVVDATPCDVLQRPADFNGKTVRLTGTVQAGFDDFALRAPGCTGLPFAVPQAIWIDYPKGTHAKAGAAMRITLAAVDTPPTATTAPMLEKGKDFRTFDAALSAPLGVKGMCLGCVKNTITATLVGRVDAVPAVLMQRAGPRYRKVEGFGAINRYRARLVLTSISDVHEKAIDYEPVFAELSVSRGNVAGDQIKVIGLLAEAYPNGTAAYGQVRRAAMAYGSPGEQNGVVIGFDPPNEADPVKESGAGVISPNGLAIHVDFDRTRLPGDALTRAIAFAGSVIADLQEAGQIPTHPKLEEHAIQTVLLSSIAARQKTLVLPGGGVLWNDEWPATQRDANALAAIITWLTTWSGFAR
jgi:hypothetical protein